MLHSLRYWDQDLLVWLNNLGNEPYDAFWIFVTQIESWTPLFLFFIGVLLYYYKGKKGLVLLLGGIITFLITLAITDFTKTYAARIRPNNIESLSSVIRVLKNPTSYSFFSGHASSSFCIVVFLVLCIRKLNPWVYLAFIWPLLFAGSRIYIGVHYPSDIIVGALVGSLIAILGHGGAAYLSKKYSKQLSSM
ncbi:MAG: Lipid A 1-diphosphate synthase [Flavobacteriaceae bacterium]|nr:MAG: Lipid A 1-diphosphate synthase [Flavobacteriaceae bacterium]